MAPLDGQQDSEFLRDNDSIYVLPLRILPLRSRALLRARMIKDARLESAIEVFSNRESGSGQLYIRDLEVDMFNNDEEMMQEDLHILHGVGALHSFDVYSLRICLREAEIKVKSTEFLNLSEDKKNELKDYMKHFTRPLVREVYGQDDVDVQDASDVIKLFSHPDVDTARQKLKALSDKLSIELTEIPKFLEDFSDIYLSIAYFQQYLDDIAPRMLEFIDEISILKENWQLRQDTRLMTVCRSLENDMNNLIAGVTGRFESFDRNTDRMWENITAERFQAIREMITKHQATIGGVLCGLGSKMNAWRRIYPTADVGGPVSRAELILSDIAPGMDKIVALERSTPLARDI